MLSPEVYKILHLLGVLLVFVSLGGASLHVLNGGTRESNRARRLVTLTYAAGLLLILVAGFGWLARSGALAAGVPGWVWLKVLIWLAVGALVSLPYRGPRAARVIWFVGPVVGALAAAVAITKPL